MARAESWFESRWSHQPITSDLKEIIMPKNSEYKRGDQVSGSITKVGRKHLTIDVLGGQQRGQLPISDLKIDSGDVSFEVVPTIGGMIMATVEGKSRGMLRLGFTP